MFSIDLPVTFPFAIAEPSERMFLVYTFFIGGCFWALLDGTSLDTDYSGKLTPPMLVAVGLRSATLFDRYDCHLYLAGAGCQQNARARIRDLPCAVFRRALYLARRFILRAVPLAIAYFLVHSLACAVTYLLMLGTNDGTERWVISMPVIILDFPVTFFLAVWQPPGILFPMYVFLVGGLFWATVGWLIAREWS